MIIVFGLGNKGKSYEKTYHNIGFLAVDRIAQLFEVKFSKNNKNAVWGEGIIGGEKIILAKPQTYMNLSGNSVMSFKQKNKSARIIVVCDDVDLPRGKIRYRRNGSGGTHNGLRDIVQKIGQEFERIKIGIGKDEGDLADFVLSKMDDEFIQESLEGFEKVFLEIIKN